MWRRSFITSCDGSLPDKWAINVLTCTSSSRCPQNHSKIFSWWASWAVILSSLPWFQFHALWDFSCRTFCDKNESQLEAITILAREVKHQGSLFQISCCFSCFGQVTPFITITSQNGQNTVLCYGVGNFKYAVLCIGTWNHLSARLAVLSLLDLHALKHHLQQVFHPYWQIPIAANSCHDRIMRTSCFGKTCSNMEQHVYMCWYLECDIYTLISGGAFCFSFVFPLSLVFCLFVWSFFTVTADKESN